MSPPKYLYHGTGKKFRESIDEQGLISQSRLHIHLSADIETAIKVGSRHGKPIVYHVWSGRMQKDGYEFYKSVNGVWLTKEVPAKYIKREIFDDKEAVIKALARVLKKDGILSIAKHNRAGREMQMAVLPDDFEKANALLDGENSMASKFGVIRYYGDKDILEWESNLVISEVFGIRTFWDLQQNQEKHGDEDWQRKMIQLEMRVAQIPEYRDIAFFHHLLLKKL